MWLGEKKRINNIWSGKWCNATQKTSLCSALFLCYTRSFIITSSSFQVVVRGRCQWRRWKRLTWRRRAGRVSPASPVGGPSRAALPTSGASSAWGGSSSRGLITSTPDLTLSAPWRSTIWIKVRGGFRSSFKFIPVEVFFFKSMFIAMLACRVLCVLQQFIPKC